MEGTCPKAPTYPNMGYVCRVLVIVEAVVMFLGRYLLFGY